jgi:hypothetical protein
VQWTEAENRGRGYRRWWPGRVLRGLLSRRLPWEAVRRFPGTPLPSLPLEGKEEASGTRRPRRCMRCAFSVRLRRRRFLPPRGLGNALKRTLRLASPIRPPGGLAVCRQRRGALLAAARSARRRRAGEAVPLAAAASPGSHAQGRPAAPRAPPWHARAAPDGPGAAPCAGGAWTAGALVRVGGRHCAGRGQAPARAWQELEVGAWCALSECATRLEAPSGSGAQGRERRAALSSVALSPRGVVRCGASSPTRSPHKQSAPLSPAWQRSADEASRWVAMQALRGCQPIAGDHGGAAPKPPGAAVPRGSAWVGRCEDATAARSKAGALCGASSRRRMRW